MKKGLIIGIIAFASISMAEAQELKRVYGGKAKNSKVWVKKNSNGMAVTVKKEKLSGGAAKNAKVWSNKSKESVSIKSNGKRPLKAVALKRLKK